jgi:hypothetical protein
MMHGLISHALAERQACTGLSKQALAQHFFGHSSLVASQSAVQAQCACTKTPCYKAYYLPACAPKTSVVVPES